MFVTGWIFSLFVLYGGIGWGIDFDLRDQYLTAHDRQWRRLPLMDLWREELFTAEGAAQCRKVRKYLGRWFLALTAVWGAAWLVWWWWISG